MFSVLLLGDSLKEMDNFSDKSVDMIFSDIPYGTTRNSWDSIIDLNIMWQQFKRIIKPNGCIALWAQAPFSHVLAISNIEQYRYEWIIEKTRATGHLNANIAPMKAHENVLIFGNPEYNDNLETVQIFYRKAPIYNPQMTYNHSPVHKYTKHSSDGDCYGKTKIGLTGGGSTKRYPRDVLRFVWDRGLHPCQKPVEACEYFIKTYTNEGDTILDPFMGSGTTGVAAKHLGRKFIGIEKKEQYFEIARKRIG